MRIKYILPLIFTVSLSLPVLLAAAPADSGKNKTFSVSTHLAKLALSGYGLEAEYHGFGRIGLFAGGYHSLYYTLDGFNTKLKGFGAVAGSKYYINYSKTGLNSVFISGEYRFLTEEYTDKWDNSHDITRSGIIAMVGKRFCFDPFFFELAIGGGPTYIHSLHVDDGYQSINTKDIERMRDSNKKWEAGMDLKVMAGISF